MKRASTGVRNLSRSGLRCLCFTALGVASLAVQPSPAAASNWVGITWNGSNPCAYQSGVNSLDGGTTKVKYENLQAIMTTAANATLNTTYQGTTLGIVWVSSGYDVKFKDKNYDDYCGYDWHETSGGTIGTYNCWRLKASGPYAGACDKATLRFDTSFTTITNSSTRQGLACHEFGHSTGLTHRSTDCMNAASPYPSTTLDSHSLDHLNGYYYEP